MFSTEEKVMEDEYLVYDSSGKIVLEIEFFERDIPGRQMVALNSPSGEKLAELVATIDEQGKVSLILKRTY